MLQFKGFGGIDGEVAGTKYVFRLKNYGMEKILHDCGSTMEGSPKKVDDSLPFSVSDINAVVLSHGHFDHIGDLIKLPVKGYDGNYFCHEATKEIAKIQLRGMAETHNKEIKGKKDSKGDFLPFVKAEQVNKILEKFNGVKYGIPLKISDNVHVTFYDAGHIIGSSQVLYEFNDHGKKINILTCVDLGRSDIEVPLVKRPERSFPVEIDYCFIESTYGSRLHAEKEQSKAQLEEILLKGIGDNKRMLMGAFSIMRTHAILSDLFSIYKAGKLPDDFKIYLDSPSAVSINPIISRHKECMDEQARKDFFNPKENPFKFPNLKIIREKSKSQELDKIPGPYLVISASGMWFMGRVVEHLKSHIEDPNALLIQTGYQVPGCTGALIEEGKEKHPTINIEGQTFNYEADQVRIRSYGAHADGNDCVKHVVNYVQPKKGVFVVHGEREAQEWTKAQLEANGLKAEIVRKDQVYNLY